MKNQQMNEELSPEQLEARRDEMRIFYEKSLPYLNAQSKYETLLTEIEEARYKRATMQINYATMMSAAQGPDLDDEDQNDFLNEKIREVNQTSITNKGADFDIDKRKVANPQVKKTLKKE